MSLDVTYPALSRLVFAVLGLSLEELADRAPATDYEYFDLERLLAHVRSSPLALDDSVFAPFSTQVRGYAATIEAYVKLGLVKNESLFVMKKLAAPRVPHGAPRSAEMLDTLAECSWGLWLMDRYGHVEAEKNFPGGIGDADFYVPGEPLWVDCISVAPTADRFQAREFMATTVRMKWRAKFGERGDASDLPAAIAVTILKRQEYVMPGLTLVEVLGESYAASHSLWADCPGLQVAWFGVPPWSDAPHRPNVFAMWERP